MDIDERVDALLKSPVGCTFLHLANSTGLTPKKLAEPAVSIYLGAWASREIYVWRFNHQYVSQEVLRRGVEYTALARSILQGPTAAWWFASLDRENQIYAPFDGAPPDPANMVTPDGPPSRQDRYDQQVFGGLFTSTLVHGLSSLFAALDLSTGDVGARYSSPPYSSWRLKIAASARVLEIDGPQAWHDLCLAYPAEKTGESNHPDFSGDAGQLVPDWSMVAAKWDAVHLGFGGLLTTQQVRVQSPAGWTYLWSWDAELTLWLRWMFISSEHLPDYEPPRPTPILRMGAIELLLR